MGNRSANPVKKSKTLSLALGPALNRTQELTQRLAAEILSGRLQPGARLPTEQELSLATGVSRTVVREAVAALRADGLVMTRQGLGAFVPADVQRRPFRIDPDGVKSAKDVLQILELRMGVEIEASGLAAERRTSHDLVADRGRPAVDRGRNRSRRQRSRCRLPVPSGDLSQRPQSLLPAVSRVSGEFHHSPPDPQYRERQRPGPGPIFAPDSDRARCDLPSDSQPEHRGRPQGGAPAPVKLPEPLPGDKLARLASRRSRATGGGRVTSGAAANFFVRCCGPISTK